MCSGLHAKEPILLNGQKCRVYVKIEAFYLVMVTSPNDEIYSNGTKKNPKIESDKTVENQSINPHSC